LGVEAVELGMDENNITELPTRQISTFNPLSFSLPPTTMPGNIGTLIRLTFNLLARTAPAGRTQPTPAREGTDDVLARATNLLIARGVYQAAAKMYPDELIEQRQGARVIEKSKP
jgi:hypothetical protein